MATRVGQDTSAGTPSVDESKANASFQGKAVRQSNSRNSVGNGVTNRDGSGNQHKNIQPKQGPKY